jgi:hypothetical protein
MDEEAKLTWGRDLPGNVTEKWPKDENGDPVKAEVLTECSQLDMGDSVLISMLDAYGIPAFRKFPHYGGFGNMMMGMSAEGVEIMVPGTLLEDARALLEGNDENEEL